MLSVPGATAVPDSYVVVLKPGADAGTAAAVSARHGGEVRTVYRHALQGYALRADAGTAAKIAADPRVAFVQQDVVVRASAEQTPVPSWGIDRIDQRRLPLNNTYRYATGAGSVTAFVIDTGIRVTHTDFGTRASWGTNTTGDGNNTDCNGHGTHVASTIGGAAHGVAKRVRLVAVKVLGCSGSGSTAGVVAGVDWVTANSPGPSVANMSLGGGAQPALDAAVAGSIALRRAVRGGRRQLRVRRLRLLPGAGAGRAHRRLGRPHRHPGQLLQLRDLPGPLRPRGRHHQRLEHQ